MLLDFASAEFWLVAYKMKNIEVFNHYAVSVVGFLYDKFPNYTAISLDKFATPMLDCPSCPVRLVWNQPFVYVGPDLSWTFGTEEQDAKLQGFDWAETLAEVETLLGRALTYSETLNIKQGNGRPLTAEEAHQVNEWRNECKEWSKSHDDAKREQLLLKETLKFLVHEGLIRHHNLRSLFAFANEPVDVLIDHHYKYMRFALTWEGFSRLMKEDPISKNGSPIYKRILAYISDKGVDVAAATATSGIAPMLFGVS